MPFTHPGLAILGWLLGMFMASSELAAVQASGVALIGITVWALYRVPSTDPATWAWAQRDSSGLPRRMWLWLVARPPWLQRTLAAVGPMAAAVAYASMS